MGNRVYLTLKEANESKTYYLHWNGGLDTWCPLAKVLFEYNIQSISQVENFLKHLELKAEPQESPDSRTWIEENGHYTIDLTKKSFELKTEKSKRMLFSMTEEFQNYLVKHIKKDYRDKTKVEYWDSIHDEAIKFFKDKFIEDHFKIIVVS